MICNQPFLKGEFLFSITFIIAVQKTRTFFSMATNILVQCTHEYAFFFPINLGLYLNLVWFILYTLYVCSRCLGKVVVPLLWVGVSLMGRVSCLRLSWGLCSPCSCAALCLCAGGSCSGPSVSTWGAVWVPWRMDSLDLLYCTAVWGPWSPLLLSVGWPGTSPLWFFSLHSIAFSIKLKHAFRQTVHSYVHRKDICWTHFTDFFTTFLWLSFTSLPLFLYPGSHL